MVICTAIAVLLFLDHGLFTAETQRLKFSREIAEKSK